ncbi:MAG: hypothetical protein HC907_33960 [Richelia sp. SM1_7_0]|nr:hypothetical protein [Richelia sp. SM1_7_0]
MAFSVLFGVAFSVLLGVAFGVASGVGFGVAFGVALLRADSWFIALFFNIRYLQKSSLVFLRITSLPYLFFLFA